MKKGTSIVKQVDIDNQIIYDYDILLSLGDFYEKIKCEELVGLTKRRYLCDIVEGFCNGTPFCIVFKNIYYLGKPHLDSKKRIEIPNEFKKLYDLNTDKDIHTFLIGVYTRKNRSLYCHFNFDSYYNNKLNNSAAHVSVDDLLNCFINGRFDKLDEKGNILTFIPEDQIIEYLKEKIQEKLTQKARHNRTNIVLTDPYKAFKKWGVTQISSTGDFFEPAVIGNYATCLKKVLCDDTKRLGPIDGFDYTSIFECKDLQIFEKLKKSIENHPRFNAVNKRCHRDLSAGLALYEKFLEYCLQSDNDMIFLNEHYTETENNDFERAKKLSSEELKRRVLLKKDSKNTYIKVITKQVKRDQEVVLYALNRANGVCDLCGKEAPFQKKDGEPYLECHHVRWLSKGGRDAIDNVVALCPNCHKKCHVVNSKKITEKLNEQLQKYKELGQA